MPNAVTIPELETASETRARMRVRIKALLEKMARHEGTGTDRDAWETACKIEKLATDLRRNIEDNGT
jgi:hypothetical protein